MHKRRPIIAFIASLIVASSRVCSPKCSDEFVAGCVPFFCEQGHSATAAFDMCRDLISSQTGVLVERGQCERGCTSTTEMIDAGTSCEAAPEVTDATTTLPSGKSWLGIKQFWPDEAAGYTRSVHISVSGYGGRMIILLHGAGGDGSSQLTSFRFIQESDDGNNVIFSPDGYNRGWNGGAPDVLLVEAIVDKAKAFQNVNVSVGVSVVGYSNGCNLIHTLLIESHYPELARFGCLATALHAKQSSDGVFYFHDGDYSVQARPKSNGRIVWFFHGPEDNICPYYGGWSLGMNFLSAEESVLAWANHFGSIEDASIQHDSDANVVTHSYLHGSVVLYELTGVGHGGFTYLQHVRQKLIDLIELASCERTADCTLGFGCQSGHCQACAVGGDRCHSATDCYQCPNGCEVSLGQWCACDETCKTTVNSKKRAPNKKTLKKRASRKKASSSKIPRPTSTRKSARKRTPRKTKAGVSPTPAPMVGTKSSRKPSRRQRPSRQRHSSSRMAPGPQTSSTPTPMRRPSRKPTPRRRSSRKPMPRRRKGTNRR